MRRGRIYYQEKVAGILTETDEGEYVFQYDPQYVKEQPRDFITFTMPVRDQPYRDIRLFAFFEGLCGWLDRAIIPFPGEKGGLSGGAGGKISAIGIAFILGTNLFFSRTRGYGGRI